jgi:hypothetical protein
VSGSVSSGAALPHPGRLSHLVAFVVGGVLLLQVRHDPKAGAPASRLVRRRRVSLVGACEPAPVRSKQTRHAFRWLGWDCGTLLRTPNCRGEPVGPA